MTKTQNTEYKPVNIGFTQTKYRLLAEVRQAIKTDKQARHHLCALLDSVDRTIIMYCDKNHERLTSLDVLEYLSNRYGLDSAELVTDEAASQQRKDWLQTKTPAA